MVKSVMILIICAATTVWGVKVPPQKLKFTSNVCKIDHNYIANTSCKIRPARGKAGYLTVCSYIQKPMTDIKVSMRHYYKVNVRFLPLFLNFDTDWCKLMNGTGGNKIITILLNFIDSNPTLLRQCPLQGYWCFKDFDSDKYIHDGLQYFLPAGDHKYSLRIYDSKNYTYSTTDIVFNLKPVNGLDYEKFKLGK